MKSPFGAAVYVSYAWTDEDSAQAVDELTKRFEKTFITFKPDKFTLQPNDSFKDFIEEIGKANCIIILYSEAYFNSFYCMLELAKIIEHSKTSCSNQAFDCHVRNRVIGINLKGLNGSYITDIDIQRSIQCATLEKEFDSEICGETYIGLKVPYKSEDEQKLIKDRFDDFNAIFAHRLNHLCIDEVCFIEILDKARANAKEHLRQHPLFKKACTQLSPLSEKIKAHLTGELLNEETSHLSSEENQLTTLLTLEQDKCINILQKITANQKEVEELARYLMPFYCQLEHVVKFGNRLNHDNGMIEANYFLPETIEILMAALDARSADLQAVLVSEQSDTKQLTVVSKYQLFQVPESGDNQAYKDLVINDIASQLGLSNRCPIEAISCTRSYFVTHHVPYPDGLNNAPVEEQEEEIKEALEEEGAATWYLIVPYDVENKEFWDQYAEDVQSISRKIAVVRRAKRERRDYRTEKKWLTSFSKLFQTPTKPKPNL